MSQNPGPYRAPSFFLLHTEPLRTALETAGYLLALPRIAAGPRGDGHHVLVLPGLLAGDRSTAGLRLALRARGYSPHAWRQGLNLGPTRFAMEGLVRRLDDLHAKTGDPVSLVGWSIGGILARELARQFPEKVRCVITLGSPFRLNADDAPDVTHASRIFGALRPWHTDLMEHGLREEQRPALRVPATSIYSRCDGMVPWEACQNLPGELQENIEVTASHFGMGLHPTVLSIVADRLAQPVGAWQRYSAGPSA